MNTEEYLIEENRRMREAGCKLAEAAIRVSREYDGIHRLMVAVSEWSKVITDEGKRGDRYADNSDKPKNVLGISA